MTTDDDRIAYLAGETGPALDPDDQADLDALRELLADPSTWAEPPASLEDRVVAAVTSEAAMVPPGNQTSTPRSPTGTASGRGRLDGSRRRFYAAVAVAAVVVAVGLAVGVLRGGSSAQRVSVTLSASSLAPGASGDATLTRTRAGWRIELRTGGLPRLDNGRYYQAWMKNGAGVLVAIGTFNEGPRVTLWSGVSPSDFPTITVTEQEANGNPASSGQRVLSGTVGAPESS